MVSDSEDEFEFWKCYESAGTPAYMAPEVAAADVGTTGYRPCSDIWSLGLVFLEIFGDFSGPWWNVTTIEEIRAEHAKVDRIDGIVNLVPLRELPPCFKLMFDGVSSPGLSTTMSSRLSPFSRCSDIMTESAILCRTSATCTESTCTT